MDVLETVIQPYAWGSRSALATLQGRPTPSPGPEAELWIGAHPAGPSRLTRDGRKVTLGEVIAAAPERELGPAVARGFNRTLPFLLKVLAAETPLSLQAHPTRAQAREGFARENATGVPLTAHHRNYKDENHKPELLCALTPFDALCGFRDVGQTLSLFESLDVAALDPVLRPLRAAGDERGLQGTFAALMTLPKERLAVVVPQVARACRARLAGSSFRSELEWALRLEALYPGDAGVIGSLLLNVVRLAPGEAIYLPAGNLHAYLHGVGVEIMASSDNVLRGGCTPKHVDVPELLKVLCFKAGPVPVVHSTRFGAGVVDHTSFPRGEEVYRAPPLEFRLSRFSLQPGERVMPRPRGPELLLCTRGRISLRSKEADVVLTGGMSAFIPQSDQGYTAFGDGDFFRATVRGLAARRRVGPE